MMGLPSAFLACSGGTGGGVIQCTASEATLVAMLAAKSKTLKHLEQRGVKDATHRLMAYCSDQAHSSVERASMLAGVKIRKVVSDSFQSLRGEGLEKAVKKDKEDGLIPFIVVGTMGTTNSCAYDNLREIGEVVKKYDIWHHVDAAYAEGAICQREDRHPLPVTHGGNCSWRGPGTTAQNIQPPGPSPIPVRPEGPSAVRMHSPEMETLEQNFQKGR
ncbi:Aromatic-L-amino-acid decarboxylase [Chionoecetes opilio]|uniref:Aromatic-L-amino-acid decarboxylase n=1 Tax=Chionoecetes opilio TaxID=41210 RepID=A0A8J4Y7F4_CHIOP|nr:Aromatic-L-amino-acid decarboxylase [Chionoecetes opilio]